MLAECINMFKSKSNVSLAVHSKNISFFQEIPLPRRNTMTYIIQITEAEVYKDFPSLLI